MNSQCTFLILDVILVFEGCDPSICSTVVFPPLGNSDHVVVSVSIDFPSNSKGDALFHHIAYDYLVLIGIVFVVI